MGRIPRNNNRKDKMNPYHYILDKDKKVKRATPEEWAKWFEHHDKDRIVKQENIGGIRVSTVFLGLDHSFGKGPPILWETMCFRRNPKEMVINGKKMKYRESLDDFSERCSGTYEQAEAMHERMVKRIKWARQKDKK